MLCHYKSVETITIFFVKPLRNLVSFNRYNKSLIVIKKHINPFYHLQFSCNPFFLKLGIRSKDRLIRVDQFYCPFAGAPFKPRAKLYMNLSTEIGTRGNRT